MSDFEKQLNKSLSGVKLSAAEKRELKARVVSYMEYHPRRETVAAKKAEAYLQSQPYTILSFNNVYLRSLVGVFAIVMVVFIPSLAERAMPGDILYPIKVSVNEEIRSTLTLSQTDKIAWETERLERRIAEVRLLASEGKLTDEVEEAAAEAVKAHAEAAQEGINKLKGTDADEASLAEVAFETALQVQSAVLDSDHDEEVEADTGEEQVAEEDESVKLAAVVRQAQETVVATKSTVKPARAKTLARIEQQTTRAYELFTSLDGKINQIEKTEIERRFDDVERAIVKYTAEAETVVADDASEEEKAAAAEKNAMVSQGLLTALADIQKLISFMTDIDVRASVELEKLVPMVPTDDERIIELSTVAGAAEVLLNEVEELDFSGTEQGFEEKVMAGVAELEEGLAALRDKLPAEVNDLGELVEPAPLTLDQKEEVAASMMGYVDDISDMIAPLRAGVVPAETELFDEEKGTTTEEMIGAEPVTTGTTTEEMADKGTTTDKTTETKETA